MNSLDYVEEDGPLDKRKVYIVIRIIGIKEWVGPAMDPLS